MASKNKPRRKNNRPSFNTPQLDMVSKKNLADKRIQKRGRIAALKELYNLAKQLNSSSGSLSKKKARKIIDDAVSRGAINPKDLGFKDKRELSDTLIDIVLRINYARFKNRRLMRKGKGGFRQYLNGKVFEIMVLKNAFLNKIFDDLAQMQHKQFLAIIEGASKGLTVNIGKRVTPGSTRPMGELLKNAKGKIVSILPNTKFSPVVKCSRVVIVRDDGKVVESVDVAHITYSGNSQNPDLLAIHVITEIKMAGASKGLKKQLARGKGRFKRAREIRFQPEGSDKWITVTPDKLILTDRTYLQTSVVLNGLPTDDRRIFQFYEDTSSSSYDVPFLQYGINTKTVGVNDVSALLVGE